jgi:hypothetical protein
VIDLAVLFGEQAEGGGVGETEIVSDLGDCAIGVGQEPAGFE